MSTVGHPVLQDTDHDVTEDGRTHKTHGSKDWRHDMMTMSKMLSHLLFAMEFRDAVIKTEPGIVFFVYSLTRLPKSTSTQIVFPISEAMDGDEEPPLKPPGGGGDGDQQQDQDGSQPATLLPDDVLANIFGRLEPRWVAVSRCVCRPWCASIDALRLLRADLLPLSLRGIFVHFRMHKFPAIFSRPSPPGAPAFGGKLSFLPSAKTAGCVWRPSESYSSRQKYTIKDHCNGLLLIDEYVVNPATRRWDALPPGPPGRVHFIICGEEDLDDDDTPVPECIDSYLVFDPTESAHYQVQLSGL
ncbi:hypothetical protein ACQ4PT_014244 [Festuca glaucescens]